MRGTNPQSTYIHAYIHTTHNILSRCTTAALRSQCAVRRLCALCAQKSDRADYIKDICTYTCMCTHMELVPGIRCGLHAVTVHAHRNGVVVAARARARARSRCRSSITHTNSHFNQVNEIHLHKLITLPAFDVHVNPDTCIIYPRRYALPRTHTHIFDDRTPATATSCGWQWRRDNMRPKYLFVEHRSQNVARRDGRKLRYIYISELYVAYM